jgi:2,3-diketo-5-methylthio-1-phosphopentane phosphatase
MSPIAVTPPPVEVKAARPALRRVDTANLGTKRKIICFSGLSTNRMKLCMLTDRADFDGTIFLQDTGHTLFDNFGCGPEKMAALAKELEDGTRSFREISDELYASLDVPFDNGFDVMKTALDIDPDFQTFHEFCVNNSIPFNVISAGLKPVLRKVLDHFIGESMSKHIEIVANDAIITDGKWKAEWRHDCDLGHDKARSINEYRETAAMESDNGTVPMIIFIGDGVSDLPAARESDILFARRGLKLEEYCIEKKLDYIPFDSFADIQNEVIKIAKIDDEKTRGKGMPANFNPRANLWRRVSSKAAIPMFSALSPTKEEKAFLWPEVFTQQVLMPVNESVKTAVAAAPA